MKVWITRDAIEHGIRCSDCEVDNGSLLVHDKHYETGIPYRLGNDAFLNLDDAKLRVLLTARARLDAALETAREMQAIIDNGFEVRE